MIFYLHGGLRAQKHYPLILAVGLVKQGMGDHVVLPTGPPSGE